MDTSWIRPYSYELNELPDIVEDIQVDANNSITYVGFVKNGTTGTDQANFKIKRVSVTDNGISTITKTEWAEGNLQYNKVWDQRADYNYSFKK